MQLVLLIPRFILATGVALSSFWAGLQADLSDYFVWMLEDPHLAITTITSRPLQGTVDDYFQTNIGLEIAVRKTITGMTDEQLAGQLLMPAWDTSKTLDEITEQIERLSLGGVMPLGQDASVEEIARLREATKQNIGSMDLSGFIAIDAEPSLLQYRLPSLNQTLETNSLDTTDKVSQFSKDLGIVLSDRGYNLNFAPVYDSARNQTVIGDRSFSDDPAVIGQLASAFTDAHKEAGLLTTAKHFPGHGYVTGDTHVSLQTVPGNLPEQEVFQSAVDDDVIFMMIGHLAISGGEYDTAGRPSTISATSSDLLLRDKMNFGGITITDAMNMQALDGFTDVDMQALVAGADIVLMPRDLEEIHVAIMEKISSDPGFREQVIEKVSRIVRAKLVSQWIQ